MSYVVRSLNLNIAWDKHHLGQHRMMAPIMVPFINH